MATTDFPLRGRERGVALFVVLGAIVLFTLLGVVGITLADRFSKNSGSLVDMRSERMTAVGALNFAVAAMQANPTATIALLNKFRLDQSKSWLQLPSSSSGTVGLGDKAWTLLGTGNDQSSVAVKILGVGVPGADSVDILLEGHGMGRGGDEFKVQATYTIHGVGLSNNVPTAGTNNALQAQAGLGDVNTTTNIDGGIYSGAGTTTIQTATTTPGSWSILRTNGNLALNANATIPSGAIINGTLGSNSSNGSVGGNLSVRGGISTTSGFGGQLTVNGAMLLKGATFPTSGFAGGLYVRDSLLVTDAFFNYTGSGVATYAMKVGSGVGSWAVFNKGFRFSGGASPSQINGNLFVEAATTPNMNGIYGGTLNVTQNAFFDADFTFSAGGLNLNNNVAFRNAALLVTTTGNGATMNVAGQSSFGGGIAGNSSSSKYINLNGDSYLSGSVVYPIGSYKSAQITFNGGGNLYLSGTILPDFGTLNQWVLKGTAPYWVSPIISYMYPYGNPGNPNVGSTCFHGGSSYPCDFSVTYASPVFKPLANVSAPTWSWLSTPTPTMTETSLGFTTSQQDLTLADNPVSTIAWSNLPASYQSYANWTTLWAAAHAYSPTIFPNLSGNAPTGTQLLNLYNFVKSQGKLYGGSYMIIHVTSGTMGNMPAALSDRIIPSGVKIFFEFDNVGTSGLTLYSGSSGSVQIVEAWKIGGRVDFSGSFYGFVQLHATSAIQFQPASGASFYGSLEVADASGSGTGTVTAQGGTGWSISNQSPAAQSVFQDIANTFNNSAVNPTSVIKFNGDANTTTPFNPVPTVVSSDGWIQFVRKGEFR